MLARSGFVPRMKESCRDAPAKHREMDRMRCTQTMAPLLAAAATALAGAETIEVMQVGLTFSPETIEVLPGDTVVWQWTSFDHTVTSGDKCTFDGVYFDAPLDAATQTFEWVVPDDATGEIPYFCIPHCDFEMVGLIVVLEETVLGDFNGDGLVNGADLGIMLGAWGTDDPEVDLNGDGIVDGADLGIELGLWTS